jgi:hypothetical protein
MKYYSCTHTLITFETGGEHIPEECTQILTLSKEEFEVPSGLVLRVLENGRAWWPKYLQQENNTQSLTRHASWHVDIQFQASHTETTRKDIERTNVILKKLPDYCVIRFHVLIFLISVNPWGSTILFSLYTSWSKLIFLIWFCCKMILQYCFKCLHYKQ